MFEEFKFRIRKFLPCQAIGLANALVIYLLVVSFFFLSAKDIAEQIVKGFSFPLLVKSFILVFLISLSYSFTIISMLTKLNEQSIRKINYKLVLKGTLVNLLVFLLLVAESIFIVFYLKVNLPLALAIVVYFLVVLLFVFIFSLQLVYFSLNGSKLTKKLFILSFLFSFVRLSAMQLANFLSFATQVGSAFLMPLFDGIVLPPVLFELNKRKEYEESKINKNLSIKKFLISLVILSLIISSEFKPLIVFSLPSDRLNEIISQAIAEGWSNEELSNEIKKDNSLVNYLSTYDLDKITIDRREDGSVVVNIPSKNLTPFYYVYSKVNSSKIVYDVYKQVNGTKLKIGDKVYVLSKYDTSTSTYGPLSLEEAVSLSNNLQKKGEITNIYSREASRKVVKTKEETTYSIVPYVREISYETKVVKSFDSIYEAQNYLNSLHYEDPSKDYEVAEGTKLVGYQLPVYSYYWELAKSFSSYSEALSYANEQRCAKVVNSTKEVKLYKLYVKERTERYEFVGVYEENDPNLGDCLQNSPNYVNGELRYYGWYIVENGKLNPTTYAVFYGTRTKASYDVYVRKARIEGYEVIYQEVKAYDVVEKTPVVKDYYKEVEQFKNFKKKEEALASEKQLKNYVEHELKLSYIGYKIEESKNNVSYEDVEYYKVYYVNSTTLTPLYNVYQLISYNNTYKETSYKEYYAWVDKGYASTIPSSYDNKTWVYIPELVNYTKIYLGLYIEPIAVSLANSSARYLIEKYNDTTIKIDVNYYNVYELIKKLMYDYYVWVQYPVKEYLVDNNITSLSFWSFDKFGEASTYLSEDAHSKPYSLCLSTKNGIGALRQSFYYKKDQTSAFLSFWYKANGSVLFALRTPDDVGYVFSLDNSNDWKYYSINLTKIMNETGYYLFSLVAHRNSALLVDDISLHSGGYGEWTFVKEVESKPSNYSSLEKYLPFYKILGRKLIGSFPEYSLSNFSSSDYVFEFNTTKEFSFKTSLYRVYYLSGGSIRYKVYHYEELKVPVTIIKTVSVTKSELVEENVRAPESGVPVAKGVSTEEVERSYADPIYRVVPRVVSEEREVLILNTTNKDEADSYRSKGYIVKTDYKSIGNDITISFHVLYAEIVQDETRMLGKYNLLKVVVSNPSPYSYSYEVNLEASNNFVVSPNSFSLSASSRQSSGGGFSFIVQKKVNEETPYPSENRTFLTSSLPNEESCDFLVVLKRGGKIVAEYKLSRTFKGFNPVESINLHPGEFVQGFVSGAATAFVVSAASLAFPVVPIIPGLLVLSTIGGALGGIITYAKTGDIASAITTALTMAPTGIVVAPIRVVFDPTLNDSFRASIAGGFVGGVIGAKVGQIIGSSASIDLALSSLEEEYGSQTHLNLASIAEKYGDITLSQVSELIRESSSNLKDVLSLEQIKELVLASTDPSRSAEEIVSSLELISKLPNSFVENNYKQLLNAIYDPTYKERIAFLSTLSKEEISSLCEQFNSLDSVFYAAYRQKLGDISKIIVESNVVYVPKEMLGKESIKEGDLYEFLVSTGGEEKYATLEYVGESYDGKLMFSPYEGSLSVDKAVPIGKVVLSKIEFSLIEKSGTGSLTKVKAFLSPDGIVEVQGKKIEFIGEPELKLVSGELIEDSSKINEIAVFGKIKTKTKEYSILFVENKNPYVAYGGTYLPAALVETEEGVKVGDTVALFDGGSLVISNEELASRGIRKYDIVSVVYPNGEYYSSFYTGGDLVIPSNGYTGVFVDLEATKPNLSESTLSQLEAAYNFISKEISKEAADSFASSTLRKLTEAQVLDVSSTIANELPSLKVLGSEELKRIVEELVEYESNGKSAEEKLKEILKENDNYLKAVKASSEELVERIETVNPSLAEEVRSVALRSLEEDSSGKLTNEFLEFIRENYKDYAYAELEEAENKELEGMMSMLKLDDSSVQLTDIIPRLKNVKYYEFRNAYVEKAGRKIFLGQSVEEGRYLVRATTKDGRVYEWIVETTGSKRIWVSSEYYDELKGETLDKLQLISYIPEIHFPKEFSVSGHSLYLDLFRKTLTIDGREVKIVNFEENPYFRAHKFSIKVETNLKSIRGAEIVFMFYEDETVELYISSEVHLIYDLSFEPGNVLTITYSHGESGTKQAVVPLEPKELKLRTPIELGELSVDVEGKDSVRISEALKKVFGYDNFKTLQEEIENDEAVLLVKFDDGSVAYSKSPELDVHVPEGAKKIVAVEIFPAEKTEEDIINKIMKDVDEYEKAKEEGNQGEMNDKLGEIGEGIAEIRLNKQEERERISKYLGVPPERLFIKPLGGSGEVDFEIYQDSDKGTLLAIVEVKTTTVQDNLIKYLRKAKNELIKRFSNEYKDLEHGFVIVIYTEDPKKLLQPGEKYDFIPIYYNNPYKK
jgi:hypothetical protein